MTPHLGLSLLGVGRGMGTPHLGLSFFGGTVRISKFVESIQRRTRPRCATSSRAFIVQDAIGDADERRAFVIAMIVESGSAYTGPIPCA